MNKTTVLRTDSLKSVRTPEALRVTRQALPPLKIAEFGSIKLDVPDAKNQTLSLFLSPKEAAQLKTADKHQVLEIRYWHSEVRSELGSHESDELESIRDGQTVILDRTRCELHEQVMTRRLVPIGYGLPMSDFLDAMDRDFPHAALQLGGCCIDNFSPTEAPAYVCPACEAAYKAWKPASKPSESN